MAVDAAAVGRLVDSCQIPTVHEDEARTARGGDCARRHRSRQHRARCRHRLAAAACDGLTARAPGRTADPGRSVRDLALAVRRQRRRGREPRHSCISSDQERDARYRGTRRIDVPTPFWETAVQAGLRASVLDTPICAPPPRMPRSTGCVLWSGALIRRCVRPDRFRASLISEVIDRHGSHPCRDDDPSAMTVRRSHVDPAQALRGHPRPRKHHHGYARRRCAGSAGGRFLRSPYRGASVPQPHGAGTSALRSRRCGRAGRSAAAAVYQAIDAAIGRIVQRLPAETTVLIVCLGGLQVIHGGSQFLDDVLRQTGLTASQTVRASPCAAALAPAAGAASAGRPPAVPKLVRRSGDSLFWASFDWAATRAFALPWTYDGYLRVNLRGREPHGIVEPGAERGALLDEIETMLRELKIAGTDKPAVRRIVRAQEVFAGRASAELPDLMVTVGQRRADRGDRISAPRPHRQSRHRPARQPHRPRRDLRLGTGHRSGTADLRRARHRRCSHRAGAARDRAAERMDGRVVADLLQRGERSRLSA